MKTANCYQDCDIMRKPSQRKSGTVKASSRKSKKYFYPRIDDLLVHYPITTVNEYGERVIYGKRIC
jgi:hypothetical protein